MNAKELLKITAVAVITAGFVAGCASSGSETAEECQGPSPEAKNVIYAAKLKNSRAKSLGYDSTENDKMLEAAEKAAADCDDATVMNLAKQIESDADKFIAKYNADQAAATATPPAEEPMNMASHVVAAGDNLWDIAGNASYYGNPYQWPLIYKANAEQIKDADLIFPGQSFDIPKATAGEIEAAVEHAKNRGAWTLGVTEASDLNYLAQ